MSRGDLKNPSRFGFESHFSEHEVTYMEQNIILSFVIHWEMLSREALVVNNFFVRGLLYWRSKHQYLIDTLIVFFYENSITVCKYVPIWGVIMCRIALHECAPDPAICCCLNYKLQLLSLHMLYTRKSVCRGSCHNVQQLWRDNSLRFFSLLFNPV